MRVPMGAIYLRIPRGGSDLQSKTAELENRRAQALGGSSPSPSVNKLRHSPGVASHDLSTFFAGGDAFSPRQAAAVVSNGLHA
jgi:hypothetical protein